MTAQPIHNPPRDDADQCRCQDYANAKIIVRLLIPGPKGPEVCRWCYRPVPHRFTAAARDSALLRQDLGGVGASTDGQVVSHAGNAMRGVVREAENHTHPKDQSFRKSGTVTSDV